MIAGFSAASASRRSVRREHATTSYPLIANARAVAAPIPLLAPVTIAVSRLVMRVPRHLDLKPDRCTGWQS